MKVFIGVDVGGTTIKSAAVNSQGEIVFEYVLRTPAQEGPSKMLEAIALAIHHVKSHLLSQKYIFGKTLGIGWPGPVDTKSGIIFETHNIKGFSNFDFYKNLESSHNLKAVIANDAKCAAQAEKHFGHAKSFQDFVYLTFGTGIGGVIFSDGEMISGNRGLAGEIGHMILHPNGELCGCGTRGCFERYCSAIALERRYSNLLSELDSSQKKIYPAQVSAKELIEHFESGSPNQKVQDQIHPAIAEQTFFHFIDDLSNGLGSLMTLLNPEAIVFSGGLFKSRHERLLRELKAKLDQQGFKSMKREVQFVTSELHGKAGVLGAAALVMQ